MFSNKLTRGFPWMLLYHFLAMPFYVCEGRGVNEVVEGFSQAVIKGMRSTFNNTHSARLRPT